MIRSYFFATYPTEKPHDLSFPSATWEREKINHPFSLLENKKYDKCASQNAIAHPMRSVPAAGTTKT